MKRLIRIASAMLLLLALTGCFEKEFENKTVSFKGSSTLNFSAGETKTLTAILPDNGVETQLSVESGSELLKAELSDDNILTMSSDTAGNYTISLTLSAKGYKSATVNYPIEVSLREQNASVSVNGADASKGVSCSRGDILTLDIKSDAKSPDIDISVSDESLIKATQGEKTNLEALLPGKCEVTVSISAKGFEPYSVTFTVDSASTPAMLELNAGSVSGIIGQTLYVGCQYQPQGEVTAACDDPSVSVSVSNGQIAVSSNKAGSYEIAVSCTAESYSAAEKRFTVSFAVPQVTFNAPQSVSLQSGSSSSFTLSDYPNGTSFSISSTARVTASLSGNTVTLTGNAAGSATLSITASCSGYQSRTVNIPVTVTAVTYKTTSAYDKYVLEVIKYTNQERARYGLSQLSYAPEMAAACQIRAKEASILWAHDRPDGRSWETVIYDVGLNYIAAGENLLDSPELDAQLAVDAWMDSPGHRENILQPTFNAICVGIYKDGDRYYYAQHFLER